METTLHARLRLAPAGLLAAALAASPASAQAPATESPQRSAGIVVVNGGRTSSLPTYLPSTVEGITGAEIETRINATDSEDAIKYLPSLLVRKRFIGDYNHAVLSSRASGTGNSARSLVYADGILLSNLLGNGAAFTPRWGLVTPEEIDRVDVLYGPFSAAYPGNAAGAVVDFVTRLPTRFEAHAKLGVFSQPFELYGASARYSGWQGSASLGNRDGGFAWWLNLNRLDSSGQPMTFATRLVGAGTAPTAAVPGTPVSGAVLTSDRFGQPWLVLGSATQYRTVQDHAKLKLVYDIAPTLQAAWTLGRWQNQSAAESTSALRRDDGSVFYSGVARIDGRNFNVGASDFGLSREQTQHLMQGLAVKRRTAGSFDWEVATSRYDYQHDLQRVPTQARPAAEAGGAGRLTNLAGTGWTTWALKGVWRPTAAQGAHRIDGGLQQEGFRWRQAIDGSDDWLLGAASAPQSRFRGDTRLQSLYLQDAWTVDERWQAVLGGRLERWTAWGGSRSTGSAAPVAFAPRRDTAFSPKAALGFQAAPDWSLKLSSGRAVRVPTVAELFQGNAGSDIVTNPALRPEVSWTSELSSEWTLAAGRLRTTLFHEDTRDALYSQAIAGTLPIVSSVQNVDRMRTVGLEAVADLRGLARRRLDLQASVTLADSRIVANSAYVTTPGDTVGKRQPRVPRWRASALASWQASEQLSATLGLRYGGRQYGTLDNSDWNGATYLGFSKFLTSELRLRYLIDKQWSTAFGIDNLNNARYWNFHPYPQRSVSAELRYDL